MTEVKYPNQKDLEDHRILQECAIRPVFARALTTVPESFWDKLKTGDRITAFHDQFERVYHRKDEICGISKSDLLQAIARYALRIGAWSLLKQSVIALLCHVRHDFATQHRLSIATGLTAEWALASGNGKVAYLYASESLNWGSETHRIRAYLAYATYLISAATNGTQCCRDRLSFELSRATTAQQPYIHNRNDFTHLHHLRLMILHRMDSSTQTVSATDDELALALDACKNTAKQVVDGLADLAYSIAQLGNSCVLQNLASHVDFLRNEGRWREIQLLGTLQGNRLHYLTPEEQEWLSVVDGIAHRWEGYETPEVDRFYIDQLPTQIESNSSTESKQRLLCCI